jgi:hypothetical protein
MFLVKAKVDGNSMVIPCQGMGPDPKCPGMVRLDGCDLQINNFRATFLTLHPQDIEFAAEGIVLQPPVNADQQAEAPKEKAPEEASAPAEG